MFLKKILPSVPSSVCHEDFDDDDDDNDDYNSLEYSFAIEYNGPPVVYNEVPKAVPINIKHIPIAAKVASTSPLHRLSMPVVQPVVKTKPSNNRVLKKPKLGSGDAEVPSGEAGSVNGMSDRSSVEGDSSGPLGCVSADECKPKPSDELGSLGTFGSSKRGDNSCELSGSSDVLELPDGGHGSGASLQDCVNPTNLVLLRESDLSAVSVSSEGFSCQEDNCDTDIPRHVKRPSIVTFVDPESSDTVDEDDVQSEPQDICVVPEVERNGKKGSCYRCSKGNRFTAKEACIVCGAKYCSDCILRAMGSMPEGRKCLTCIGFGIDESKRGTLGKCSRMLKWLLSESQLKQVMSAEILCEANQLPPELVYVNDETLCLEELILLQSCPNPPKKLRPGKYWYDKVSGFWGKQGEKPSQMITPQLSVGGHIKRDASNGDTNVLINNREITKSELWMLQLAGEKCEGSPHFWVSPDGSYSEEGQRNIKGRIWVKKRTKLLCTALSLPISSTSASNEEEVNNLNNPGQNMLHKLLLVGYDKCGTSTIFKEAKILYNVPFSEDERQNIKFIIQTNLYAYLGILLQGRAQFEEEYFVQKRTEFIDQPGPSAGNASQIDDKTIYSIGPRLKRFSDWLLEVMKAGNLEVMFPTATREYAPFVEELWNDPAIQATYNRRNELQLLPKAATYFLERAIEVSRMDYEPSDIDILYAEGVASSNKLTCMEFSFPKLPRDEILDPVYRHESSHRYELIRVHPKSLGGNCKWLEMFEDVDIVLFCVSLIDYDQYFEDSDGFSVNKMMASKQLFERIVNHPTSQNKNFLLILNKFDLFEEKIEQVPLTRCEWFPDFKPVISHNHSSSTNNNNPSLAIRASHYIASKFKALFQTLTNDCKLYASVVTGLDQDTVDEALRYAREIIKWSHEESNIINEISSTSIEETTTS